MNAFNVIQKICPGIEVVEVDGEFRFENTDGEYIRAITVNYEHDSDLIRNIELRRFIRIKDMFATDTYSLTVAAHEAYHALRHREGVKYYIDIENELVNSHVTGTGKYIPGHHYLEHNDEEERIVQDLAEKWVAENILNKIAA